ncbi:MAG: trimethylamine methyltransferase family protein, partial [Actinobacteria bacterium]|nr:trimethylamine methyltransferase family protein [Actinomycetota bacterium]
MTEKGFIRKFPPLNIITEENVNDIKAATFAIMKETGVTFQSKKALDLFKKNGCLVDYDNSRVRFHESMVQECIRKCPNTFLVKARDPKKNLIVGGNYVHFISGVGKQIVDLETWMPRTPTKKEHYDAVTILDALENLDMLSVYAPYFGFEGIESKFMILPEVLASKLRNSDKYTNYGYISDSEIFSIKMAKVLDIDIGTYIAPTIPLAYNEAAINNAFRAADSDLPIMIFCGGMGGADSPSTLAGAIACGDATGLAVLVLIKLINPKNRIWSDCTTGTMNMETGDPGVLISASLGLAAHNQVMRSYGLPIR